MITMRSRHTQAAVATIVAGACITGAAFAHAPAKAPPSISALSQVRNP